MENPDIEQAYTTIQEGFNKKAMIIILAKCHVEYEGRARSRLAPGDRLILIKKDGTFAIHQELNLDPVNWQAPGCKNKVSVKNNQVILTSKKTKPTEEIKVYLDETYSVTYYNCIDTKELEIRGYEKHMVDLAWEKPELIEKGFRPTRREYQTENGFIDLMGTDKDEKLMILEFKSRKAGTNAVKQLKGYVECFMDNKEFVRGIIVAPDITDNARELLESLQMEFIQMNPPLDLLKHKTSTLDSFLN
ncbi:endonuclease NucS [Methanosphaera sp.]|uniref:endonuclease NucS n=1 Tax=Methanosphaera sp. TaxID=2666342 RepID=UPI002A7CA600|nr:endonuclease NucS [Methanosphaera sp.]